MVFCYFKNKVLRDMFSRWNVYIFLFFFSPLYSSQIWTGADIFLENLSSYQLAGKRVALITNQTGVDRHLCPTWQRLLHMKKDFTLVALFSPEHGLKGQAYAEELVAHGKLGALPVYSLHGETRRPTKEMLKGIDVLIYDIQDIGVRSYTYATTLFYAMEEAARLGIEVIVLDRPNPINGITVDGPMLDAKFRSFIGYINVPYCHGMTIGELAQFFNAEYQVGCQLRVIPMRGWQRRMSYRNTGLIWIPPSPNIPEADTPFFYSSTGILGELRILNIGVGYTLPFKIAGAPWLDAERFAEALNQQKLAGVYFFPFYFKPFHGLYKHQNCQGILIHVTDSLKYRPLAVQSLLLGILKTLYPKQVAKQISSGAHLLSFNKANGTDAVLRILREEKYATWKLISFQEEARKDFLIKRKKYLIADYLEKDR